MEQGPLEETLIRRARAASQPLPAHIAQAPQISPGLMFYFTSFVTVSSCRPLGMSEGRIPWTAVWDYGDKMGLDEEEIEDLWMLVSLLDGEYLKLRQKQAENRRAADQMAAKVASKK